MSLHAVLKSHHLAFEHELDSRLQRTAFRDVRAAHLVALAVLPDDGESLTGLARRANMTKQSMQYLIDHLDAAGYVQRSGDPDDKRAHRIHATDRARKLADTLEKLVAAIEHDWAARLGKGDFATLKRLLQRLDVALKGV